MRRFFLVLLTILPLIGCFDSQSERPGKKDALEQIREALAVNTFIDIADMEYVNGFQKDISSYVVSAKYHVVFKKSTADIQKTIEQRNKNGASLVEGIANIATGAGILFKYGDVNPGDTFEESGNYLFLKTENGWIFQGEDK